MTVIYVPISQKSKYIREHQKRYVSKLVGEGWVHEGVVKLKDTSGTEIEVVVLVGKGFHDDYEDKESEEK